MRRISYYLEIVAMFVRDVWGVLASPQETERRLTAEVAELERQAAERNARKRTP